MKTIKLTQKKCALVDDNFYEELSKHKWCAANIYRDIWYAKNGKLGYMHNLVFNEKFVDHINRNGLDNRMKNLRKANKSR